MSRKAEKGLEVVVCMHGMRIQLPQEKPEKWWQVIKLNNLRRTIFLACQPDISGKPAKARFKHLYSILVHKAGRSMHQALLLVLLRESDRAGDGVADVDGGEIVKVHLRREKTDPASNMGDHATGKQASDNPASDPTALHEYLVDVVRVLLTGYSPQAATIPFATRPSKAETTPPL